MENEDIALRNSKKIDQVISPAVILEISRMAGQKKGGELIIKINISPEGIIGSARIESSRRLI